MVLNQVFLRICYTRIYNISIYLRKVYVKDFRVHTPKCIGRKYDLAALKQDKLSKVRNGVVR